MERRAGTPASDEDRILARLRTLRSDLIDPTIAVHHGRVVKRTGDGSSIIEFRSVVDVVNCAIEVQRAMVERNAEVAPDKRIEFRIGVHLGDVVEENDGDLMGDGVNIAARLEGICEPGGVCLSEDAYRQVKSRLELKVADLGRQNLKNIAEPVHAYLLRQGAPGAVKSLKTATNRRRRIYAVAAGLAATVVWAGGYDPEQQYFADGITDDLTTDLSHIPESFVIARDTAFTYKGRQVDAKAIGRELGVRYVLEGSVRRATEKVEINAQLISTETGAHVWADRFEGERSNLGKLQFEVVARLANSLGAELMKAEVLRTERERPGNPDSSDLTMRGWAILWNFNGANKSTWNNAIAMFERALALDPKNESAMTGLATALFAARTQVGAKTPPASRE